MDQSVSVIIVNYNGGPLLTESVRSVLASDLPVEVLVSDNASTDASLIELRLALGNDSRLTIIENAYNLGFAKANNVALARARHAFLLFLNPDCLIGTDTLSRMLQVMKADPEIGMAGCLITNPDGSEQPGCRRSIPTPQRTLMQVTGLSNLQNLHPAFQSYLHTGLPLPEVPASVEAISGAFMLVRRQALEVVGPMDEAYFMHFEDLDWCLRFQQAGWKVCFVPGVKIVHVGGVCTSSRPLAVEYHKHRGMFRFYRKFFCQTGSGILMYLALMPAIVGRYLLRLLFHGWARLGFIARKQPRKMAYALVSERESAAPRSSGAADSRRVAIVTGATSLIGDYLLPGLVNAGFKVHAISRKPPDYGAGMGVQWHHADIAQAMPVIEEPADVLIHLAPLAVLPPVLEQMGDRRPRRVVGFGSTSRFTKANSAEQRERLLVQGLEEAEQKLGEMGAALGFNWTVFRPTLVYHLGRDKNVTVIAEFLRKFRFFPLIKGSRGRRQPVHAEDLAMTCIRAIDNPASFGKAYNLCGGETLTYQDMVKRTAAAIDVKCVMLNIPLPVLKAFIRLISVIPRFKHLNPEMAARITSDMVFDNQASKADLGFSPRVFLADRNE